MRFWLMALLLISSLFSLTSFAAQELNPKTVHTKDQKNQTLKKKIKRAQKTQKYLRLQKFLRKEIRSTKDIKALQKAAKVVRAKRLLKATRFALNFQPEKHGLKMKLSDLMEIGLFIETRSNRFLKKEKFYLTKKMTRLKHTLEYDPETKKFFVLLDKVKGAHIGQGVQKRVTKSILYSKKHPEVLARAEQHYRMVRELNLMKLLKGKPGLFITRAFTNHREKHKRHSTVYSNLYNLGSLEDVLEKKSYKFSLDDELKIAYDLITGLISLKEKNILHRDLRPANCFIELKKKGKKEEISAVLADFGCSKVVPEANHVFANAVRVNTAPEGLILAKMEGEKYFGTDLFATGCVLYRLCYGKCPPWRQKENFNFDEKNAEKSARLLAKLIYDHLKPKYEKLDKKREAGILSRKNKFEYIILRMLDPNPDERGDLHELRQDLAAILKKEDKIISVDRVRALFTYDDETKEDEPKEEMVSEVITETKESDLELLEPRLEESSIVDKIAGTIFH